MEKKLPMHKEFTKYTENTVVSDLFCMNDLNNNQKIAR